MDDYATAKYPTLPRQPKCFFYQLQMALLMQDLNTKAFIVVFIKVFKKVSQLLHMILQMLKFLKKRNYVILDLIFKPHIINDTQSEFYDLRNITA